MLFNPFIALVLLLPGVLAAPSPLKQVKKVDGRKRPNGYIVTMKDGASKDQLLAELGPAVKANWKPSFVNGFAGVFNSTALELVRAHPDVATIIEDGVLEITGYLSPGVPQPIVKRSTVEQIDATWGLERISRSTPLNDTNVYSLSHTYRYKSTGGGQGVDVYVVDTGIFTDHQEFEGRARWGATFGGYADEDIRGHGTHCAGIIGGVHTGVAKNASLIAVRVVSDDNVAHWSDVGSALDWIVAQTQASGRPSVASLSLSGRPSYYWIDEIVARTIESGVHVVVAAGNWDNDASGNSPAGVPEAITVGAMDINNGKASFSSYGSVVDVFAPGVTVFSSFIGNGIGSYAWLDGTSMATPHVAGLVASLLSDLGNMTPAAMSALVKQMALSGVLNGIPTDTANLLINNGFTI